MMRKCLDSISDSVVSRGLTLFNCLMSGLAVFRLKNPSPLEFDELVHVNERSARTRNHSACSVFKIRYSGHSMKKCTSVSLPDDDIFALEANRICQGNRLNVLFSIWRY